MLKVLAATWPLLLGMLLLMLGNGLQGTLLGIRGGIEGFETWQMSVVMSAYFAGFLIGSQLTPRMLARVGHVRVFAALGSLVSAVYILYAAVPDWIVWTALRVLIGFCFAGIYVTAESWLNDASTNETRGQSLSLYMIVQMLGIITAQGLLNLADPGGYALFVIASVLVSLAFTPILLTVSPAPAFSATKSMGLRRLWAISPLGCVGVFVMGGIYAAILGMAAVWGGLQGLSVLEISIFVAAIYSGGLVFQYPIGWLSDRTDRRQLIAGVAAFCAVVALLAGLFTLPFVVLVAAAFLIGGMANPLYALLLAHTNDYLNLEEMAGASGGLLFINGVGAVSGPLIIGWLMGQVGPGGFFLFIAVLGAFLFAYTIWRMRRREAVAIEDQGAYTPLTPTASVVTLDAAFEAAQTDSTTSEQGDSDAEDRG